MSENFLVHKINEFNWDSDISYLDLNGDAISDDWKCCGTNCSNEISFYRVPKDAFEYIDNQLIFSKNQKTDFIALKLLVDNVKKSKNGFLLLLIDESHYPKEHLKDDPIVLNTQHVNLINVKTSVLIEACEYTNKNYPTKSIKYSMRDLHHLLDSLVINSSDNTFALSFYMYVFEKQGSDFKKARNRIKEINSVFYPTNDALNKHSDYYLEKIKNEAKAIKT